MPTAHFSDPRPPRRPGDDYHHGRASGSSGSSLFNSLRFQPEEVVRALALLVTILISGFGVYLGLVSKINNMQADYVALEAKFRQHAENQTRHTNQTGHLAIDRMGQHIRDQTIHMPLERGMETFVLRKELEPRIDALEGKLDANNAAQLKAIQRLEEQVRTLSSQLDATNKNR